MTTLATSAELGAPLTKRQLTLMLVGVMTGLSLAALDATIVHTALATIVGELGGIRSYSWVGTSYLLTSAAATPLFGKLSDLYGRRPLFEFAIATFLVGSLLCGLSQSMGHLVISRAIQGIGGGGLLSMAWIIVGDAVPPRERGRYIGYITSVFATASVTGPLLGGFFVESLSWRWIFLVNIPIGIVALVVSHRTMQVPFVRHERHVDFLGASLLVGAVTTFVLIVSWASEAYGWRSLVVAVLLVATAVLTAAFLLWERRAADPILPLHLFGDPVFRVVTPIAFLLGSIMFGANAFLPLFLQSVTGVSPTASGLLLLPLMAGVMFSSITTGRLTVRTGRYRLWPILGTAVAVVGLVLLTMLDDSTAQLLVGLLGMLVLGLGVGAAMPATTLAVQNSVDWQDLGIATSLVQFFRGLGGVIGLAAFGAVLNSRIAGRIDESILQSPRSIPDLPPAQRDLALDVLTDGVTTIFKASIPVVLVSFVLAWFVEERPLRDTSPMQRRQIEPLLG